MSVRKRKEEIARNQHHEVLSLAIREINLHTVGLTVGGHALFKRLC